MERIIWIPWPEAEAGEFIERSEQWQTASPKKGFAIITYGPGTVSDTLREMRTGSIYMRGHGMPGSPFVTTHGKALHIARSIDRIIEMGLQKTFTGKIKFYSCYSAVDSVQKIRSERVTVPKVKLGPLKFGSKSVIQDVDKSFFEGSRDCLARRGAAYFRSQGFTSCVFQGYSGPLSGKMEQKTDEELAKGHYHKHCLTITFNEGTPVSGSDMASVGRRASAARSDF